MAINKRKLRVTELDFDNIKDNLKIFLKAQTEFKDYDFEGSGMSVLLDTLAYNTHYLGFNANMLANEMFLDSSALRSSVVSHAKTLGYEVSSPRAPIATVNISLSTTASTKTMPAGTAFTTTVDGTSYQFVTVSDITSNSTGSSIPFDSVNIYEGSYVTTKYTVDTSDVDQRFLLSDARSDTTTLKVKVQNSASDSTTTTYTKATDITQLSASSTVYFIQETDSGLFEIYFGDGKVSTALSDGNIVILQYVVTNKTASNGATAFGSPSSIDGVTGVTTTTVTSAVGGSESESIQSIKLNAPLDYAAQGRCVTSEDYKVYAKKLYPNAQSVQVFGGESGSFDSSLGVVSTAEYGKVFISIKSTTGLDLTSQEKTKLVADLAPYTIASTTPVIVDPLTVSLILNTNFKFDSSATTLTVEGVKTAVTNALVAYNSSDLGQFDGIFRHSKVTGVIDDADTSILGNITNVTMGQFFTPTTTASTAYTFFFNNALYNPHSGHNASAGGVIASTGFYIDGDSTNERFFDDNGEGGLRTYYLSSGTRIYDAASAGTVTYSTGKIVTSGIYIVSVGLVDGAASSRIRITAIPDSKDIVPVRNQILEIDFTNSTITGGVDTIAVSDSSAGATYTTTSSYTSTSSY